MYVVAVSTLRLATVLVVVLHKEVESDVVSSITMSSLGDYTQDPLRFAKLLWPTVTFYREQRDIIYSIRDSDETYVVAGNMLGKDYVAGFISLSFFIKPQMFFPREYVYHVESDHMRSKAKGLPRRRIITTSVKDDHLRVLWAEIGGFYTNCRMPLNYTEGGPLAMLHHEIRLTSERQAKNPESYLLGCVSLQGEGMAGHHAPYTLMVIDEASGVDDLVYTQGDTWAKRKLIFGNPNACQNFFRKGVKQGDLVAS